MRVKVTESIWISHCVNLREGLPLPLGMTSALLAAMGHAGRPLFAITPCN